MTLAATRTRQLSRAMGTGLLARGAGAAVQLFAIPFAAAALGNDGFVVYGMAAAILGWLLLFQLGLGPALTLEASAALGRGARERIESTFATGLAMTVAINVVVTMLALVVLAWFPGLFRPAGWDAARSTELAECALVVLVFFNVANLLNIVEGTQVGFQQQHRLNLFTVAGSIAAVFAIVAAAVWAPRASIILLAAQGPMLVARAINALDFVWRERLGLRALDRAIARRLLSQGLMLMGAGAVSNFLLHAFPILFVGTRFPAELGAEVLALMNMVIILSSFFALSAAPLMGAVPEARERGDMAWIRQSWMRIAAMNIAFGLLIAALLATLGTPIFSAWFQGTIIPPALAIALAGLYLVPLGLEVVGHAVLCGLGRVRIASSLLIVRGVATAGVLLAIPELGMPSALFMLLCAGGMALTAIPFSLLTLKVVK